MEPHLSDGTLARLVDGEADAPERSLAEAHLARCAGCGARHAALERRSSRLAALLRATDYAIPAPLATTPALASDELAARRTRRTNAATAHRPWLAAAAAVVLLLGIGLATSPARASVAAWIGVRWAELARLWAPADAPMSAASGSQDATTSVVFATSEEDFAISFASPQRAGTVVFTVGVGTSANVEVHTAGPEPDVLVLPAGVRIQNATHSTAEYRVTLPAHTRRVRLQVGDHAPAWIAADEVRESGQMRLAIDGSLPARGSPRE
jgi:anti-sigma factor RsiW